MSSFREQHPPKPPAVNITDFVEVEAGTEPVIEKFQIIDDEPCYEKPAGIDFTQMHEELHFEKFA